MSPYQPESGQTLLHPPEGRLKLWVSGQMCGGGPVLRWVEPQEAAGMDPGQREGFPGLMDGCPTMEWPLATLPGDGPLPPCHGKTTTPPLTQQPSSLPSSAQGLWQPNFWVHCTAKGALGAASTPGLASSQGGKALENQDAGMLGPKDQQTCSLMTFFLPLLNTWLLSQGIK